MFNLNSITEKNNNEDWPYRKLIIGPSGSGKTNYLLNSIQRDPNVTDKIYLYAKDLEQPKCKLLINKIDDMDDILSNIEDYNKKIKLKVLIIFDDMISHVMSDKRLVY